MRNFKDFLIQESKTAKDTYISLKKEINDLLNNFNNLYNSPSVSEMKEQIWKEANGDRCINDIDWLFALQNDISNIINQKAPLNSVFISSMDSIDKKYEKMKDYLSKILPFIEKNIKKCDLTLREYGYAHAWMDFDECKYDMDNSMKILKKLETVENEYRKADTEKFEVWNRLMQKCEELYKFAEYVLASYNPRQLNWNKHSWIYSGKKEVENFLDYTFNLLEKNKNIFEKNMSGNEYYLNTGNYSGNIGKY